MRRLSLVVILCVVAATTPCSAQTLAKKKCHDCESKTSERGEAEGDRGPRFCPLWEVLVMAGGILYYCDYFDQDDCLDEPEVVYAFGEYDWPCACDGTGTPCCELARKEACPFPGLIRPVPANYVHGMPAGRSRECSRVLADPSLGYIKCDIENRTIFAKVFFLELDVDGATGGIPTGTFRKSVYVAFETSATPTSFVRVTVEALEPACEGKHYAYKGTTPDQTKKMLILTVRQ